MSIQSFVKEIGAFGVEIKEPEISLILKYEYQLKKWQQTLNLISMRDVENFWNRHVFESAVAAQYITGQTILDIGSGGGFPGIIMAILSQKKIICVDCDTRKTVFLREISRSLKLDVDIINSTVEDLLERTDVCFDSVTSRATFRLEKLLKIASKSQTKSGVFLKGTSVHCEIEEAKRLFHFEYELKGCGDHRCMIVKVSDISKLST